MTGRRLDTTYSTLTWSADGSVVTKARDGQLRRYGSRFDNELRVNRLLLRRRPPVPTPRLLAHDRAARTLTFEAVAGQPLGPKYPTSLPGDVADVDRMLDVGAHLAGYRPRRRWLRRLRSDRRVRLAGRAGLLTPAQTAAAEVLADRWHREVAFAHGDLTARNLLEAGNGRLWLIDWEWAGLYPPGYETAFLWFSLVDLPGGRSRVEAAVGPPGPAFLLSALLIQLWHLQWFVPPAFRAAHLATRDELLGRLGISGGAGGS